MSEDLKPMTDQELLAVLLPLYRPGKTGMNPPDLMTINDVHREVFGKNASRWTLYQFCRTGKFGMKKLYPGQRARLSRFLRLYQAGLVTKSGSKVHYHEVPPPEFVPPKPPMIVSLKFDGRGRPRMVFGQQPRQPEVQTFFGKMLQMKG